MLTLDWGLSFFNSQAKAGHTYSYEHLAAMFTEADLDCNEVLDLNELLLLLRGDIV